MIEVDLSKPGAKTAVIHVLKRLGVQDEAERFKLEVAQELKGSGITLPVARETGWVEMTRMFVPREEGLKMGVLKLVGKKAVSLSPSPSPVVEEEVVEEEKDSEEEPAADPEVMAALLKKISPVDFFEDIRWVYLNLANEGARRDQAPNTGAWGLLEHVRKYPKAFFDQLLPKALAKAPDEEEGVKREKRRIEEIEDMLFKLQEVEES